jgi:hypothetical protein
LTQSWKAGCSSRVQRPPGPLQMTVMDYAFKVNVLAGYLEREVVPPSTAMMAASTSLAPAPTLTSTTTVGLLRRRLPLLNYFVPLLMCSSSVLVELVMD